MSNRVTSIVLKDNQLGNKIKATVKEEREIYVEEKESLVAFLQPPLLFILTLKSSFQIYETPYVLKVVKKSSCMKLHLFLVPNEIILEQLVDHLNYKFSLNNC